MTIFTLGFLLFFILLQINLLLLEGEKKEKEEKKGRKRREEREEKKRERRKGRI